MLTGRSMLLLALALSALSTRAAADTAHDWKVCTSSPGDNPIIDACSRVIDGGGYVDVTSIPAIVRFGDQGPLIEALQQYLTLREHQVEVLDGTFGPSTRKALLAFQTARGPNASIKDILREAAREASVAGAYQYRGAAHVRVGNLGRAIADLDRAINLRPDFPEPFLERAKALAAIGHLNYGIPDYYGMALADLDRAIQLKPDFDAALSERIALLRLIAGRTSRPAVSSFPRDSTSPTVSPLDPDTMIPDYYVQSPGIVVVRRPRN